MYMYELVNALQLVICRKVLFWQADIQLLQTGVITFKR